MTKRTLWHPPFGWVLAACECDPQVEHCATCDERRDIVRTIVAYERLTDALQQVTEFVGSDMVQSD